MFPYSRRPDFVPDPEIVVFHLIYPHHTRWAKSRQTVIYSNIQYTCILTFGPPCISVILITYEMSSCVTLFPIYTKRSIFITFHNIITLLRGTVNVTPCYVTFSFLLLIPGAEIARDNVWGVRRTINQFLPGSKISSCQFALSALLLEQSPSGVE